MPSFDIVSVVDLQEVRNAVVQVQKEVSTRFDFKGSKSSVELLEKELIIVLVADDKMKLDQLQDLLRQKLARRSVGLRAFEFKDAVAASGGTLRQEIVVKQGIEQESAKRITKAIKEMKEKVNAQIQGDQVRVSGKKRDDLQSVIAQLRVSIADIELQFVNFRD